jgi:dihydroceramidase
MIVAVGTKTRSIISHRVPDRAVRREVKKLATWGSIFFISGFILWNIDQIICESLTTLKRAIGMPWSFVFELHGWWHVFTGMGAYICMLCSFFLLAFWETPFEDWKLSTNTLE